MLISGDMWPPGLSLPTSELDYNKELLESNRKLFLSIGHIWLAYSSITYVNIFRIFQNFGNSH